MSRTDAPAGDDALIRAAGAVVWRPAASAPAGTGATGIEVAVVHRPRYDDWSLPKGKCDPGESWEDTACREVAEETGLIVVLGEFLGSIRYVDRGRSKEVRYWTASPVDGDFVPNDEVDELRWVDAGQARDILTHATDADLVDRALARSAGGGPGWAGGTVGPDAP